MKTKAFFILFLFITLISFGQGSIEVEADNSILYLGVGLVVGLVIGYFIGAKMSNKS